MCCTCSTLMTRCSLTRCSMTWRLHHTFWSTLARVRVVHVGWTTGESQFVSVASYPLWTSCTKHCCTQLQAVVNVNMRHSRMNVHLSCNFRTQKLDAAALCVPAWIHSCPSTYDTPLCRNQTKAACLWRLAIVVGSDSCRTAQQLWTLHYNNPPIHVALLFIRDPLYLSFIINASVLLYDQNIVLCGKQLPATKKDVRKRQATAKTLRKTDDFRNFPSHSTMSKYTECYRLERGFSLKFQCKEVQNTTSLLSVIMLLIERHVSAYSDAIIRFNKRFNRRLIYSMELSCYMLRSHHLCLYSNTCTQRKNYEVRSCEVSGKVCAGGVGTNSPSHYSTNSRSMLSLQILTLQNNKRYLNLLKILWLRLRKL